jgi:hypothetical protein
MELTLVLRSRQRGQMFAAGMLQANTRDLGFPTGGGRHRATVYTTVSNAQGAVVDHRERPVTIEATAEGLFVLSYSMEVASPGSYAVSVVVREPGSDREVRGSLPVQIPALWSEPVGLSTLMVLLDVRPQRSIAPDEAIADFQLAGARLVPRFGRLFATSEAVTFLCRLYGGQPGSRTGKPLLKVSFDILQGGQVKARAPVAYYDNPDASHSVGPIPLSQYEPGAYTARLTVLDRVAGTEHTQLASFTVIDAGQ